MILLLKMVPKYSAKVLSNLPKHKKAVMCLYKENTCVIKSLVQTELTVLLAVSSVLLNQQYQ